MTKALDYLIPGTIIISIFATIFPIVLLLNSQNMEQLILFSLILVASLILSGLLGLGIAGYLIYKAWNIPEFTDNQKILWTLVLIFFTLLGAVIFYYTNRAKL